MAGYVPLFDYTNGTLYGRWPDTGLWPFVLSKTDKNGVVDIHPAVISGCTGLPIAEVIACMRRFCEPDPNSRSQLAGGARLQLLDQHRDWGWIVVNHGKYREKGRKQSQQSEYTQSGRDAERKRLVRSQRPVVSSDVQSCPSVSGSVRPSDSDANTLQKRDPKRGSRIPDDFSLSADVRMDLETKFSELDVAAELEAFREYWRGEAGAKALKVDWVMAFRVRLRYVRANPQFRCAKRNATSELTIGGKPLTWS